MIDPAVALRVEKLLLRSWPSAEMVEYDGWILRASGGYTKRANSVNPHFGSSLPLQEKLDHCEGFFAARGLPSIFRLTPISQPTGLDGFLEQRGYTTLDPTFVMTGPVRHLPASGTRAVRSAPAEAWHAAFGSLRALPPERREHHRWIVDHADGESLFALIEQDGRPTACGLGVLVEDALGLFDLLTAEVHRRQGLGTSVLGHVLEWASTRGARTAYLQVHSQNDAAVALYRRLGFEVAYPYWYRIEGS